MANFLQDQFELILGTISGITGGAFGWLVGRKKNKAEVSGIELENIRTVLGIHKEELNDLRVNLSKTRDELTHCRDEMEKILNERLKNLKKG
jgi:uncharacterized protein (DUF3084 family)